MEKVFELIKKYVLVAMAFIVPLFFLNITQEYFVTNKLYFLIFAVLILLIVTIIQSIFNKKITWKKSSLDLPILLFLFSLAASTIISSPDKIQAILNLNFGLGIIITFIIIYFFLTHTDHLSSIIYHLASGILSISAIILYFQPFKNINLSQNFMFLKNPAFAPIGNQLDLVIFLGFFLVVAAIRFFKKNGENQNQSKYLILNTLYFILSITAISLTVFSLLHQSAGSQTANFVLPPFRLSWYAALEVLKTPVTAFFGAGIDNFSSVFTLVKDFAYNQSSLWQIASFNVSRSTILQIMTEAGLLGLISFGYLLFSAFQLILKQWANEAVKPFIYSFIYLFICLLIFPTSLIVWFLFFLNLVELSRHQLVNNSRIEINFDESPVVFLVVIVVALCLSIGAGYFSGRAYMAELDYKSSLNAYVNNNAIQLYNNQKQAIILNPYMEKYRISFSQANLLIANSIIGRANQASKKSTSGGQLKLSSQDKQMVVQAIQTAISEAKAAVGLNPQRATNWDNLATVYRNIINLANDANTWTISAYQRAIQADPQNPNYRLNLGGVYYFLGSYDDAISFFTQAISLKPDFANAHYNLAWSEFQKGNFSLAASSMQTVLTLINPQIDKADYDKAAQDLANFKSKSQSAAASQNSQPSSLNLSTKPPTPQISPKLELHK